jgi:hypothetical protein
MNFFMWKKHTLFLKVHSIIKQKCFEFKIFKCIYTANLCNAQITYGMFLLGMGRYHLAIIFCQHSVNLAKWSYCQGFLVGFWPTQPCQDPTPKCTSLLVQVG